MSDTLGGLLTIALLLALLAAAYVPLGDYMARVYTSTTHLRVERAVYRLTGVNPDAEQGARSYATSVVGFSLVSIVVLMGIQLGQAALPMDRDLPGVPFWMSFNTAVSFVTNTNWQSYAGESTLGFTAQMAGLAVQNFLSAAVGIAVAVALIRGFVRSRNGALGNFWVDLTRGTIRILLPMAFVAALLLVAGGVVQSFADSTMSTLAGHSQVLTGGPVASQEAIKELGNNGGGFFNANSAHPFENPTAITNFLEIFLILVLPVALTRTLGTMLGNRRQGLAVLGVMGVLWSVSAGRHHLGRGRRPLAGRPGRGRRDGGQGDALRRMGLRALRGGHDRHLDGRGQRVPRLPHRDRWRHRPGQHDAGRDRARRRRSRHLRHPRDGDPGGLRRGPDGGPDARAARQEDQREADDVRRALHADHARPRARRHRHRDLPRLHG